MVEGRRFKSKNIEKYMRVSIDWKR